MSSDATNLYKAYNRASHTVSKTRQIVMLYDGAIRFLQQAGEAIENHEIERRYQALTRASEVIAGLQSCIDFSTPGDMAKTLFDFYTNIDIRILTLHRTPEKAELERLLADLKPMRDAWNKIDRGDDPSPTTDQTAPPPAPGSLTASA
jgi:flagellar protein FliS